jgi:hypothetical protein
MPFVGWCGLRVWVRFRQAVLQPFATVGFSLFAVSIALKLTVASPRLLLLLNGLYEATHVTRTGYS